jgi:hypothetical protein
MADFINNATPKADERGELASFYLRMLDGDRNASGNDAGMRRKPEAPEGRVPGPDNYDAARQNADKQTPADRSDRRGPYNGRPQAQRP